jgi:hypothetical protein
VYEARLDASSRAVRTVMLAPAPDYPAFASKLELFSSMSWSPTRSSRRFWRRSGRMRRGWPVHWQAQDERKRAVTELNSVTADLSPSTSSGAGRPACADSVRCSRSLCDRSAALGRLGWSPTQSTRGCWRRFARMRFGWPRRRVARQGASGGRTVRRRPPRSPGRESECPR